MERKKKEKEDDDDFCLSVFKEIKDNIKITTEEIFGEDVFQEPLTIKKELIKNNKDKDNNRNHNKKLFLPRHAIIKKFRPNLYYSYECINNSNLTAYIYEKTETAKINVTLKNDGTLDWPENLTKLIFDEKSEIKGEEIILKPQKKGTELNYEIIFNNLEKLTKDEYKSHAKIIVKGEQIGEKLILKIKIKKKEDTNEEMNKNMDVIENFRVENGLDEIEYPNERIFKALKENDFDFEQAFWSLLF